MEDEEEVLSSSTSDSDTDFDTDSGDAEIEVEERKSQNVEALIKGNLIVKRQSLLPRVLSVGTTGAAVCRKPFKPPSDAAYTNNQDLSRRLSARKRFVPWGSTTPIPIPNPTPSPLMELNLNVPVPEDELKPSPLPPGVDPLVLWQPPQEDPPDSNFTPISVDTLLLRFLRPHQR